MIPEIGQLCLVLALLVSLVQSAIPWLSRAACPHSLLHLTKSTATAIFLLIATAFAALLHSYAVSDFSVLNVVLNSHSTKPMLYKIVGAWGNHEGSMLLWMLVLATCGFLVAMLQSDDPDLKATTLSILGLISAGVLGFLLFTSSPFLRVFPSPLDGEDLNPILQDIGLALHPPTLYVGYVGFGVVFAYAMAGLLHRRIDAAWARTVHPWILLPWSFLTFGIGAGSWWAYRELGWGGWWFWDPVENVSLLPWLVGTALMHSNLVLMRRGQLARWVVLLAILAFTLSLIGTFIVRSGLITSVHAFATDPTRGMYILGYIGIISGGALLLYSLRTLPPTPPVRLASRSGFILVGNLLLITAAAIVLLAILYPLMLELLKLPGISVGPPYFNATFIPATAALPLLAALAPLIAWDGTSRAQLRTLLTRLAPAVLVAVLLCLTLASPATATLLIGSTMAAWLAYGTAHAVQRARRAQTRFSSHAGLRMLASAIAHVGFACFVLGMTLSTSLKKTYELPLSADAPMQLGPYTLELTAATRETIDNYTSRKATFELRQHGRYVTTLTPELRYYPIRAMQTTEAALHSTVFRDLYVVLGESTYSDKKEDATLGVRLYINPAQQWVWIGFILASLGGGLALLLALNQRRHA